ncbi:MAG: hypothetical protein LBE11_02420 [Prevotellaceae bacterium]|jgi:hypothetical protein|nr:hypothetical protein [Prevotellaceae bacterium]
MANKHKIANEIAILFKSMKLSSLLGIIVACFLFFVIYNCFKYINPDIKINIKEYGYIKEIESIETDIDYKTIGIDISNMSLTGPTNLTKALKRSCKEYVINKLGFSLLIGLIVFLGIPVLVVLYRRISHAVNWVNENKTI